VNSGSCKSDEVVNKAPEANTNPRTASGSKLAKIVRAAPLVVNFLTYQQQIEAEYSELKLRSDQEAVVTANPIPEAENWLVE
jgi:hypothetical protein